ncbi:amidohydrolase family protein [Methanoculleus sp. FWC-SCC1]|uniref:Dihydroorotase n=1 Tax=Methanoculleus frigidifontis TaxID=2584085 RepID=A0ABT8M6D6_9EURY|nr:dihydroorotase [Methanoculleus sp. FWC-SCC1]MDN7023500.1 amidohydrolase family protein [Methanoculleus sp. FWC-SCC1]
MTEPVDLLLKNVTLPDGRVADVSVDRGVVRHVGAPLRAAETVDCSRLLCLPAAVDMHVHMRGGEQAYKENFATGTASAVAGGVTVVVDQPNTIPPITTAERLRSRVEEAHRQAVCGFAVNAGVTGDADLAGMWRAGALAFGETFAAPSSYGEALPPEILAPLFERIRQLGGLATVHAEEVAGDRPLATLTGHDRARPAAGEVLAVTAVGRLAPPGLRLHFCHLSTADAVDAARGSVEVTPHHLFLSREAFDPDDAAGKVNPPLRSERERKRLWSRWEKIDVIASDHAPHTHGEKSRGIAAAPSGIPGVETMVPLLVAEARKRRIPLPSVIEKTSWKPADLLGIPRAGFAPGDRADYALYPESIAKVDPDQLHSRCGWSPYAGYDAVFPAEVIVQGVRAYHDGAVAAALPRWHPGAGYNTSEDL